MSYITFEDLRKQEGALKKLQRRQSSFFQVSNKFYLQEILGNLGKHPTRFTSPPKNLKVLWQWEPMLKKKQGLVDPDQTSNRVNWMLDKLQKHLSLNKKMKLIA